MGLLTHSTRFTDIVRNNVPTGKRGSNLLAFLYMAIKPLSQLFDGTSYSLYSAAATYAVKAKVKYNGCNYVCKTAILVPEAFNSTKWTSLGLPNSYYQFWYKINYFLKFNAQVMNLERYLNDEFDNVNRGIYITTTGSGLNYLFNTAESVIRYYYNRWNIATPYVIDERIIYGNHIYISTQNGTGKSPTSWPNYWIKEGLAQFWWNESEDATIYDYTVWVPIAVTYTDAGMRAHINQYNLAGRRYIILTYT